MANSMEGVTGGAFNWGNTPVPYGVVNTGKSVNGINAPKVDYCRPDYSLMLRKWVVMDHVIAGQDAIKEMGPVYLPNPYQSKDAALNISRYAAYKLRAIFYNATKRTLNGLCGEVFATDPAVELPSELEPLRTDVDGGGVTLDQQARMTLMRVLALGRCGLRTEYPTADPAQSLKDQLKGNLKPVIYNVHPSDIVNWRVELVGSRRMLTLVVLRESYISQDDGFSQSTAIQYRALRINKLANAQLQYCQQLYRQDPSGNWVQFGADIIPTNFSGQFFEEITFTFVGADNNDSEACDPPLYDMAVVNLGHYRNSADYEECCFMLGQPTMWFAGLSEIWVKDVLKGAVTVGSQSAVMLPVGGSAGLLQVAPNNMVFEALTHKEDQMRGLGAKLVNIMDTTKTATQDTRESIEDSSILSNCATNVSAAYQSCLVWAAQFAGTDEAKVVYDLNTDFSTAKMTPAERLQLMKEWQGNAISFTEYRERLRRGGVATEEDSVALAEIDAANAKLSQIAVNQAAEMAKVQPTVINAPLDGQKALGGSE
jgi:hypothetical protein